MIKSINKLNITYYNRINNKIYIVLKSLFTKHYACSNMTNVMKLKIHAILLAVKNTFESCKLSKF